MSTQQSKNGFSLIEVMVAVVILAVAVTGLAQGITSALRASKESEWQTTAAWLAAGQVELLRATESFPAGVTEGDGAGGLRNFHWKQTITTTSITGLRDVTVEVSHKSASKPLYELRTLLFEVPSDSLTNRPAERQEKSRKGRNRGNRP
jgi:general secretion pathway protein I